MGHYIRFDKNHKRGEEPRLSKEDALSQGPALTAYLAPAQQADAPVLLVFQEIFGVNKVMRDLCDHYADQGFTALCPDLFWRIEPGIDITDKSEEEWKQAFELYQAFNTDEGVQDIKTVLSFLKNTYAPQTPVGCVGYCLGGLLAYLSAARTNIDASVGYYGVGLDAHIQEAQAIKKPLLLHMAGQDSFVDRDAQNVIREGLHHSPHTTLLFYPDRDHAFAREGGEHYHEADAHKANGETSAFLKKHLGLSL